MFMKDVCIDTSEKVKSVFCFVIAPQHQRQGIASALLEQVINDAQAEGFDSVEAYPNKDFQSIASDFMGPSNMFVKYGFKVIGETGEKHIMCKELK